MSYPEVANSPTVVIEQVQMTLEEYLVNTVVLDANQHSWGVPYAISVCQMLARAIAVSTRKMVNVELDINDKYLAKIMSQSMAKALVAPEVDSLIRKCGIILQELLGESSSEADQLKAFETHDFGAALEELVGPFTVITFAHLEEKLDKVLN